MQSTLLLDLIIIFHGIFSEQLYNFPREAVVTWLVEYLTADQENKGLNPDEIHKCMTIIKSN